MFNELCALGHVPEMLGYLITFTDSWDSECARNILQYIAVAMYALNLRSVILDSVLESLNVQKDD